MTRAFLWKIVALWLLLPTTATTAEKIQVTASFSILADMAKAVGGERVVVYSLVGMDSDAHVYQPSPTDVRRVADSRVVVLNGLGFEGWMPRLLDAAGFRGVRVVAGQGIPPRTTGHQEHHHDEGVDPHGWQDLANGRIYVDNILQGLLTADPGHSAAYREAARDYLAKIDALDQRIRQLFAPLPERDKRVITSHDAFGYFGAAYGIQFLPVSGLSTESAPSARTVAALIRLVRREGIRALFLEKAADPRLLEQIRRETGAQLGGSLYADALSNDGHAGSYLAMMAANADALHRAMQPQTSDK